jgi:hypothetical protein
MNNRMMIVFGTGLMLRSRQQVVELYKANHQCSLQELDLGQDLE